ncbi:F-box/LRR-repeat protein 7 [Frankliniella fusca]|uniref:F-box/LRR-repeat protein 7 n=1 Tax=Frankliniella fusca TaxID=407009 RepID=A0AAE1H5D8_9NEOP|nr:F-box/LRR-repeat protein 7 [Frankliniella fusca]
MKRARKNSAPGTDQGDTPQKSAKLDGSQATVADPPPPGCKDAAEDKICFIDRLPDHLVVRIFQELGKLSDIAFILPQVCKRWKELVLHENIWRNVSLSYGSFMSEARKNTFFKYLGMAPKLGGLTFELDYKDGRNDFSKRLIKKCPGEVSVLHFIYDNFPPHALFTLLEKYKHCIEKLIICDTYTPYVDEDVKHLWKNIMNLTKLKHLVVDGAALFYHKATMRKAAPCWKTLNILDVKDCSYENMHTVQKLISVHSNWVEVYLATTTSSIFRGEVKALAKCMDLETVQFPFCREFKFLEKCEKLDSIVIDCVKETSTEVNAVIPSLSKKSVFPLLKTVKVIGGSSEYVPLLRSLFEIREITLLNLVAFEGSSENLTAILKETKYLKSLYLHEMSVQCVSAVVNSIIDNNLPKLEDLNMFECYCDEKTKLCLKLVVNELKEHSKVKVTADSTACSCKF